MSSIELQKTKNPSTFATRDLIYLGNVLGAKHLEALGVHTTRTTCAATWGIVQKREERANKEGASIGTIR